VALGKVQSAYTRRTGCRVPRRPGARLRLPPLVSPSAGGYSSFGTLQPLPGSAAQGAASWVPLRDGDGTWQPP
jgi:hypothetical protein